MEGFAPSHRTTWRSQRAPRLIDSTKFPSSMSSLSMRSSRVSSASAAGQHKRVAFSRPSRCSSVAVRAASEPPQTSPGYPIPKLPSGVTNPPKQPDAPLARFGFVDWAEKINSRASMIGFFALLAVEGIAGKPFLELIGWQVGNGLNIGF